MEEQMFAVIDSKAKAMFIVQPHAAMAIFSAREHAQLFIDEYLDKKTSQFMEIVDCSVTLDVLPKQSRRVGAPKSRSQKKRGLLPPRGKVIDFK